MDTPTEVIMSKIQETRTLRTCVCVGLALARVSAYISDIFNAEIETFFNISQAITFFTI